MMCDVCLSTVVEPLIPDEAIGPESADVCFDRRGLTTPWQETVLAVAELAGQGPVNLCFAMNDMGDSIYDSVVLIDAVKFK